MNNLSLIYREGYRRALVDLSGWLCHPAHPLDKKLCAPMHMEKLLHFIVDDMDSFMQCPDTYSVDYEIDRKKGVRLWKSEQVDAME